MQIACVNLCDTMGYYERHLPHWHPEGKALFITCRLYGSLPKTILSALREGKEKKPGRRFRAADRHLDKAESGPVWLRDGRVAKCVLEALRFGETERKLYELHAYVVMANHVHVLLSPRVPPATITKLLKGFTARKANEILGRTGQRFWQEESFDHWVRNAAEFERIRSYIEQNLVSAGLVSKPEDWPWSSASEGRA